MSLPTTALSANRATSSQRTTGGVRRCEAAVAEIILGGRAERIDGIVENLGRPGRTALTCFNSSLIVHLDADVAIPKVLLEPPTRPEDRCLVRACSQVTDQRQGIAPARANLVIKPPRIGGDRQRHLPAETNPLSRARERRVRAQGLRNRPGPGIQTPQRFRI